MAMVEDYDPFEQQNNSKLRRNSRDQSPKDRYRHTWHDMNDITI